MYYNDDVRPVLRDSPIPPGTNVLGTDRASRDMRDRYIDHLTVMHAQECITQEEFDARTDAAMKSVTLDQLRILLRDLPALPEPQVKPERWKKKTFYVPVLVAGIVASVIFAASPFIIFDLLGLQNSAAMTPLGVVSILCGIVGAISCALGLMFKVDNHDE